MDEVKHGLTLSNVKDLIRTSGTSLLDYDPSAWVTKDSFSVPRDVRAVEKDGIPMVVRYGVDVSPLEAEATLFVSTRTCVRVPDIYAVFNEVIDDETVTYIIEERLPGTTLHAALPTLDEAAQDTVVEELRTILSQLSALSPLRDRLGPIRGPWNNSYFRPFQYHKPCDENSARDTESFIRYFLEYAKTSSLTSARVSDGILDVVDLSQPPKFSHGDLQPTNIIVHDGHVSGIVDWAEAGWYPYFWDALVLSRSVHREFQSYPIWFPMVQRLCDWDMPEVSRMWSLQNLAQDAL